MITVLYGKMGTGKSTYIMEQIKRDCADKKRSCLIVPEQQAVIAEREIAASMPPSAQLYTEATNFTRLANSVFRKHGGLSYNYITRSGKSLIMYRTLCEVRDSLLSYSIPKGREKGAVGMFLDAVGELKTYGVTSARLLEAADKVESPKLRTRLEDIALVRSVYERILYEKYADPYDDILLLAKKLEEHKYFEGASVYVDSFYGFTGAQWSVLCEIAKQCDKLVVALDMPKDGKDSDYAKISETSVSLKKMCRDIYGKSPDEVLFETDYLHKNPTIGYLCDNLWSFGAPPIREHSGVTLVRPTDEFDECEYVASEIKRLVMAGGRYSDIAVILGKADAYNGIIDMIMDKYGIPSFFSKQTDILSKPLIKMIFSAVNAVDGYKLQDISDYLKCGYADIDAESASELEGYMHRWRLKGKKKFDDDEYWGANPDGFVRDVKDWQTKELARINEARDRLKAALSPLRDAFDKRLPCKEVLRALYTFLENHKIREKLDREIRASGKEEAMETAQIYTGLIRALDTVNDVMGNEILTPEAFISVMRYALDGVKVGAIPTGEDKVTVGEASGIRTKNIRHVFILGATSGKFPGTVTDNGYFTDRDKCELEGVGIILSSLSDVKSANELLNFKNAIAVASESVYISAPAGTVGGDSKEEPSIGFIRVKELLHGITQVDTSSIPLYERIFTEDVAREYAGYGNDIGAEAVRRIFNIRSGSADFANGELEIGESAAESIFTASINMSYSKIESFVLCHFNYYCNYLLKLRDSGEASFNSAEVGTLTHAVFEIFFKRIRDSKIDISQMTEKDITALVDGIIEDYISSICKGTVASNRLKRLFDRLRDNIYVFVGCIVKEVSESKFIPEYFELPIGKGQAGAPSLTVKIGDKASVSLSGDCDRVDVYRQGDDAYIRVVDYKTGSKEYNREDAEKGLNLQLLIYLFSLWKMGDCKIRQEILSNPNGEIIPAGMMYFPLDMDKAKMDGEKGFWDDEQPEQERKCVEKAIGRSGLFLEDVDILKAQDPRLKGEYIPKYPPNANKREEVFVSLDRFEELFGQLTDTLEKIGHEMLSGNAGATHLERKNKTSPCKYCANRAVCRRRK